MAERRDKRFQPTDVVPVGFLEAGVRSTGDLVDISTGGALVRGWQDLALRSMSCMGFRVGADTVRILAAGSRWGPAFQFVHRATHDRALLQRVLRRLINHDSA